MLSSKALRSLEKSILDDLVNWKWDLMQFLTKTALHPSPTIKESFHLLFPLTSPRFSVCFPTDDYSNYKIRINSWHAESLFILICVVFKERNSSAHSLEVILKTWTLNCAMPTSCCSPRGPQTQGPSESSLWITQWIIMTNLQSYE